MAQVSRSTFGKYVLLRKLASGGMGEVFLAKQRGPSGFEKLLVIKRILSHHLDKRDYLDMFFSEAKLVARLNHNNIIQIQEMGEIDGDYYIAMEYLRGKSLRDIIDELRAEGRMLPLPHVIDLAIKLCEGLGYAHQARDIRGRPMNIVHRDINPHNVLVSYNGDLKLIDFGIAKSEMTSVHTATGTIKGKFVYMSPEQSAADPIDRRSDIFSLGIVLYEMTVLENPFVRQNVVLSLEAIQRHTIPPPSSKRADAGPIDAILQRALEKRPEDRYQTAIEMRDDLRNLFRGGSVAPAEEDISVFLHELFAADIEEEDRLLADADRATATGATADLPTRSSFELPAPPPAASLEELDRGYSPHSSDEEPIDDVSDSSFADEEPTLSGNLEGLAQLSRDASGSRGNGLSQPPRPPAGQVMTLIPPDEVVPGTGEELLPEIPTRSGRIPKVSASSPGVSLEKGERDALAAAPANGAAHAPTSQLPGSALPGAPGLGAIPSTSMGGATGLSAVRTSSSPPPHLAETAAGTDPHGTALSEAAFDEPVRAGVLEPTREMQRGEALSPVPRTPPRSPVVLAPGTSSIPRGVDATSPGALTGSSRPERRSLAPARAETAAITDENSGGPLAQPVPPWRRVGLWIAGVLVFVATAVAGFVATRAVTGPGGSARALSDATPIAPGDPSPVPAGAQLPEPSPDPGEGVARAPGELADPTGDGAPSAVPGAADPEAERKRLALAEEERRRADAAAAARASADAEKAARATAAEEKRRKDDAEKAARATAAEEKKRKADEEKAARAAAAEEKKRKAAEEKRRLADEEKAARAAAAEEKKRKADEEKAARATAAEEKKRKAEEEKTARAAAAEEKRRRADEEKAGQAAADAERRAEEERSARAAAERVERAAAEARRPVKADEPGEPPPAKAEAVVSAREKPAASTDQRLGTLTVSTSVELGVEVDGKPLGTSPAVIAVKKGSGKIKLFGAGVEYTVTLGYTVEAGGISLKLDANPWAIAKHNGLSLGKTPQSAAADARHRISLLRPGQRAPLVVSLVWSPKAGG